MNWLSSVFYDSYYWEPIIRRGITSSGAVINKEDVIREITTHNNAEDRNKHHYLLGDIGCGKSAFINSLVSNNFAKSFSSDDFWFVRINPTISSTRPDDSENAHSNHQLEFLDCLNSKLIYVFKKLADEHIKNHNVEISGIRDLNYVKSSIQNKPTPNSVQEHIHHAANIINATSEILGRKLLLIIDNLDYCFHQHDQYLFINDEGTGEDRHLIGMAELFSIFYHGKSELGSCGINIVYVLRQDSYKLLHSKNYLSRGLEPHIDSDHSTYTLETPDWDKVIINRIEYIKKIKNKLRRQRNPKPILDLLEQLLVTVQSSKEVNDRDEPTIFKHLTSISNQGLRSIVQFFEYYAWLPSDSQLAARLTKRYIDKQPLGVILCILDRHIIYSEKETRFCNVFKINAPSEHLKSKIRKLNPDLHVIEHLHSYWLKVLLIKYIYVMTENSSEPINFHEIFKRFSNTADRAQEGYFSPSSLRITLGEFAKSHFDNIITVKREVSSDDSNTLLAGEIRLTPRGKYLADGFMFKFPYLQLIVDDPDLLLPQSDFYDKYVYKEGQNYSYLFQSGSDYYAGGDKMLLRKIPMVAGFIAVLHESYQIEKEIYSRSFDKLRRAGVELIDIDKIEQDFIAELERIASVKEKLFRENSNEIGTDAVKRLIAKLRGTINVQLRSAYPGY